MFYRGSLWHRWKMLCEYGECTSGSKDEMHLSLPYPAVEMLGPAGDMIPNIDDYQHCKHTNGLTSGQKDCDCGRYTFCQRW